MKLDFAVLFSKHHGNILAYSFLFLPGYRNFDNDGQEKLFESCAWKRLALRRIYQSRRLDLLRRRFLRAYDWYNPDNYMYHTKAGSRSSCFKRTTIDSKLRKPSSNCISEVEHFGRPFNVNKHAKISMTTVSDQTLHSVEQSRSANRTIGNLCGAQPPRGRTSRLDCFFSRCRVLIRMLPLCSRETLGTTVLLNHLATRLGYTLPSLSPFTTLRRALLAKLVGQPIESGRAQEVSGAI